MLLTQAGCALRARSSLQRAVEASASPSAALAVLIPAHNEAAGIAATLTALRPELRAGDRVLVVADNCTDATAAIAKRAGAEVVTRNDATRRGKGYALDHGIRHLALSPPPVVVILDADCQVDHGSLAKLASLCARTRRPVQSANVVELANSDLKSRFSQFAFFTRNYVRPLGMRHLGLPCQLMGTGMAFPWHVIARAKMASGHLTEDLELGLELAAQGEAAFFCPDATVRSPLPDGERAAHSQRSRWEHGHLRVIGRTVPRLMAGALAQRNVPLLALALDASIPPLSLFALLASLVLIATAALAALGGSVVPAMLAAATLAMFAVAVGLAWAQTDRTTLPLTDLARMPLYLLWKLPIYARFFTGQIADWRRATRKGDG